MKAEIGWTLLYFETQWEIWVNRALESDGLGHKAYALKQGAMWERFGIEGLKVFEKLK